MKKVNVVFFVNGPEVEDMEVKYYNKKKDALNAFNTNENAVLVSVKDVVVGRRKSKF